MAVVSMPPVLMPQDSVVVTELALAEARATDVPTSSPAFSTALTVLGAPSAAEVSILPYDPPCLN